MHIIATPLQDFKVCVNCGREALTSTCRPCINERKWEASRLARNAKPQPTGDFLTDFMSRLRGYSAEEQQYIESKIREIQHGKHKRNSNQPD